MKKMHVTNSKALTLVSSKLFISDLILYIAMNISFADRH